MVLLVSEREDMWKTIAGRVAPFPSPFSSVANLREMRKRPHLGNTPLPAAIAPLAHLSDATFLPRNRQVPHPCAASPRCRGGRNFYRDRTDCSGHATSTARPTRWHC